jgi:hypothetical protein
MEQELHHEPHDFDENLIDAGDTQVAWEAWEYEPHERSLVWFIIAGIIGAVLLVYAISTANYLFAIIVLMMGVIMLIDGLRHPDRIDVHITDQGLVFGDQFYNFNMIKDFSIIYEPPDVKLLYVDFNNVWQPFLVVPLENVDPNVVRDNLLPYAFENLSREEEALTDMLRRMYKL